MGLTSQIQLHYFERRHSSALASPKTTFVLRVSGFLGLLLALYLLLGPHSRTSTTPNFVPSQRAIQSYPATMAASSLKGVVANATGKHTATLIFSHGLGDTGAGWSFLAEQLAGSFPHVKFMFPNAPNIPITINGGYKMPGWFDVKSLRAPLPGNARGEEDEKGIMESVNKIHSLVDAEIEAGLDASRVVVGGFSQGAAVSLLVALTTEKKLGGVIGLSGWLPMDNKAKELRKPGNENLRVFMGHGKQDNVVQFAWGEMSYNLMKDQLAMPNVEFHSYNGLAHSANEQELMDLAKFLNKVIPQQ